MAELSIQDINFVREQKELNRVNREFLRNRLLELGVKTDRSFANFLLLRFLDEEQANAIDLYLKERGFNMSWDPVELPMEGLPEDLPRLKADWLNSGDTEAFQASLQAICGRAWTMSIAKFEAVALSAWPA